MTTLLFATMSIIFSQGVDAEEYQAYCDAWRQEQIADAIARLETLRATYRSTRRRMKQVDARALMAKIKALPKEIKALEADDHNAPTIELDAPLTVGQMGTLKIPSGDTITDWEMKIIQVPASSDALVQSYYRVWHTRIDVKTYEFGIPRVSVYKDIGPRLDGPLLWFTHLDAASLVTGAEFKPHGCFKVEGTKTYPTVGGRTKTVFVLRQLDLDI